MSEAEPNRAIKDFVTGEEGPKDWRHRETVQFLYSLFDTYRNYFFAPGSDDQLKMPQTVVAVDALRHDTLAAYRLTYNPNGLPFEIIMNALWIERPRWELAETLLHESVHLFQEFMAGKGQEHNGAKMQGCKSGYHNKDFVAIAEDLGLHPILGVGAHWRPGDGQFARLMELLEIEKPEHADGEFSKPEGKPKTGTFWWDDSRGKTRGTSTLTLYQAAECTKPLPCKLRSGKKDLNIGCLDCLGVFRPVTN